MDGIRNALFLLARERPNIGEVFGLYGALDESYALLNEWTTRRNLRKDEGVGLGTRRRFL